jgi:type I restriction enzyme S subunit
LKIKIRLPPLGEQKKIAEILSTWDKSIETTEKLIAAKQKLKKSLMQRLLTGSQRFPEFHAQEWKVRNFGEVLTESRISGSHVLRQRRLP